MEGKQFLKDIAVTGTPAEKKALFSFTLDDSNEKILKKFKLFSRSCYPHYFQNRSAPFHDEMVLNYIKSYRGECNGIEIAFRGAAKTSMLKLWITYALLNDGNAYRKYIKVLSKDLKNARQFTTDVYNNLVSVKSVYGDVFEKEGDVKREETMGGFTMKTQVKLQAGTVGQTQRGHLQDAFRPDYIIFEDIEDRESISSIIITEGVINRCDEAIQGLSFNGNYQVNANYISDAGSIQWFLNKKQINSHIVPIIEGNGTPTWDRYSPEKIEQIKADTDDWAGEYLCLKPDTLILTKTGYKRIDSLSVGDTVITHKDREKEVLQVFESERDDLLDITVDGEIVTITENHPVLTVRYGIEDWIPAGNLIEGDLVVCIRHDKLMSNDDEIQLMDSTGPNSDP